MTRQPVGETVAHGEALERKLDELLTKLRGKKGVLVALSGGVDSSLVAYLAKKALGDRAMAVTADSATLPPGELDGARRIADRIGIRHVVIKVNELRNPDFARNPPERCYYCKKELIAELKRIAAEEGMDTIVDGTNADDLRGHRPGAVALREEGVYSPLADVGLTKDEVRALARMLGLPTADKPSMACLASRFPYGQRITAERLSRVAEAERFVRSVAGVRQVRVRDHGDIARIEVGRDERRLLFDESLMDAIAKRLHSLGFTYVTMDVEGYREGSMDEALRGASPPRKARRRR